MSILTYRVPEGTKTRLDESLKDGSKLYCHQCGHGKLLFNGLTVDEDSTIVLEYFCRNCRKASKLHHVNWGEEVRLDFS